MKKRLLLFCFLQCMCCIAVVNAQETNNKPGNQIQANVKAAVTKAYAASVLMWEFDTLQNSRMSAQFSGVVVAADGEILSAAHVVTPGKTYQVMFPDGRQCIARGLGRITIPPTFMLPDAAMLQIVEKAKWPFVEMGWSSSLKINQPCISIAYPESLEQRKPDVRFGHIAVLKNEYGFMESTCVMEPGDSGGPLFDLRGRLIGIHSGIEKSEEINYEIPVDTYRKYHTALIRAENYTALPAYTNAVGKDNADPDAVALGCLDKYLKFADKRLKSTCVTISSVIDGKACTIAGTIFSLDGMTIKDAYKRANIILSKSSMVGDDPNITLSNGKVLKAIVTKRDRANDLAILLPASKTRNGISLQKLNTDTLKTSNIGNFLISIRPDSISRISVLGSIDITLPKITSYGYLGAVTRQKEGLLVFTFIQHKSAAEAGGLATGDQLLTIDDKQVSDELDVLRALQKYRAGDTTNMVIMRKGERMLKKIVLKYPPQKMSEHPADHFTGGKSVRRDGFTKVFVHDARIKPSECGGPVFDAAGNLIGINIARLSRTSTIAIPAAALKYVIATEVTGI